MRLLIAQATDVGRVRAGNEDSVLCIADPVAGRGQLLIVADGMGGAEAGEVASRMAVDTVAEVYGRSGRQPPDALVEALTVANERIYQASCAREDCHGMGTTCTAVALHDGRFYLAYLGDSRAYLIRGRRLQRLTRDHSVWADRVRDPGVAVSPSATSGRNELMRAMGVEPDIEIESTDGEVRAGDWLVVCSDGLWGNVTDPEILATVRAHSVETACKRLVQLANERGGRDNITVVVAKVRL